MGPENTLGLLMASAREQELHAFLYDGVLAFSCFKTGHADGPCHEGMQAALAHYAGRITDLLSRRVQEDMEAKR